MLWEMNSRTPHWCSHTKNGMVQNSYTVRGGVLADMALSGVVCCQVWWQLWQDEDLDKDEDLDIPPSPYHAHPLKRQRVPS